MKYRHHLVSWIKSLTTILVCLVVLLSLQILKNQTNSKKILWQRQNEDSQLIQESKNRAQPQQQQPVSVVSRQLLFKNYPVKKRSNPSSSTTDDATRDETCRSYLMQFLNGTTDGNDECVGMYNAFTAADCKDESGFNNLLRNTVDNSSSSSSAKLIDDFFESWECCEHISAFYEKHCKQEQLDATRLFGIVTVMIVCWLAKSLLRVYACQWIPDAGACILVGASVGLILRLISSRAAVNDRMIFNNNLFLQILLPPIIFESALIIDKRAFRRDLFPIFTFAIFGTAFSAVAIGYITFYVSSLGSGTALPLLESLLFGALISSIDPIATLSILSGAGIGQDDTLYTLVFGESLLNDGVTIVLFDSLVRHIGDQQAVGTAGVLEVLYHFIMISFGSILVGLGCGSVCTFYFWAMQGQNTAVSEGALFFTWALIPYYIADALKLSGIISIMVMGFMLDYYVIGGFQDGRAEWTSLAHMDRVDTNPFNPPETWSDKLQKWTNQAFSGKGHMQQHSRSHVGYVAEVISSIVETAIFAYLGLFLFNDNNGDIKLTAAGIFACVSSRAVMVLVLCALINIFVWLDVETKLTNIWRALRGRGDTVDARQAYETSKGFLGARTQFILFTAGIRGAVSYALVQMIPVYDAVSQHGSLYKGELRSMTSATIVGVLFVFGALTYFGIGDKRTSAVEPESTLTQLLLQDEQQIILPEDEGRERAASFELDLRQPQRLA